MKVILLKDIPGVGKRNAIVDVNDGYSRNFLLPKRFAEIATEKAVANLKHILTIAKNESDIENALLEKSLEDLHGKTLVLEESVNEVGHLFKGLNAEYIKDALMKDFRINLEAKCIKLEKPLKAVGEYTVPVDVSGKKTTFTVSIKPKI